MPEGDTRGVCEEEPHVDTRTDTEAEPVIDAVMRTLAEITGVREIVPLVDIELLSDELDENDGDTRPEPDLSGDLLTDDVARGDSDERMELVEIIDADAIDELGFAVAVTAPVPLDAELTETLLVVDADIETVPLMVTSPMVDELQTVELTLAQLLELVDAVDDTVPLGVSGRDAEKIVLADKCPLEVVEMQKEPVIDADGVSDAELDESSDAEARDDGEKFVDGLNELLGMFEGVGDVEGDEESNDERVSLALDDGDRDGTALPEKRPVLLAEAESEGECDDDFEESLEGLSAKLRDDDEDESSDGDERVLNDASLLAVAITVAEMLDDGELDIKLLVVPVPVLERVPDSDSEEKTEPEARGDEDTEVDPVVDEDMAALCVKPDGEILGDADGDRLDNTDSLDEALKLTLPLFERETADETDARVDTDEHGVTLPVNDTRAEADGE